MVSRDVWLALGTEIAQGETGKRADINLRQTTEGHERRKNPAVRQDERRQRSPNRASDQILAMVIPFTRGPPVCGNPSDSSRQHADMPV
jgi:hypothetical protein